MSISHFTGLRPVAEPLQGALKHLDNVAALRSGKSIIQNIADLGGWDAPAEQTERYRMLSAALAARGTPYRSEGGRVVFGSWAMVRAAAVFATERDLIEVQQTGWGLTPNEARLALTQWGLTEIRARHAEPGDVLLFEMPDVDLGHGVTQKGGVHAAILSAPGGDLSWAMLPGKTASDPKVIHVKPARACCESYAGPITDRLVAAYSFDTARKVRPFRLAAA